MSGWGLVAVSLVLFLSPAAAQNTCSSTGIPGMPGIPGLPGLDGRNGQKGEKGVAGGILMHSGHAAAAGQKGQKGESGIKGKTGKIGKSGVPGPVGQPGPPGPPGDSGEPEKSAFVSAFSVKRTTTLKPAKDVPVVFSSAITNINEHYDTASGKFVCQISGTYYFVYHTSLTRNLCAKLMLDGQRLAIFCDHWVDNHVQQVSSGGLAVYVKTGQQVWLETDNNNGMYAEGTKGDSVFSGFLVYAH